MTRPENERKQAQLRDLMFELAKSQEILATPASRSKYFKRLEDIYWRCNQDNFRHFYSEIFSILTLIDGDPDNGSLEILAQNIQTIKDGYQRENLDERGNLIDVEKEILKLYDHTNLDIARINYTKNLTNETLSELAKNKQTVEELESEKEALKEQTLQAKEDITNLASEMQEKQKEMQKDYVAILGIFASIVLAFTGQFSISGSILENIGNSSAYRLVLVSLIISIVLFNIIWALIELIREVCNKENKRKGWSFWLVNILLIGGIIGTCISYKFDWFSRENIKAANDVSENVETLPTDEEDKTSAEKTTDKVETEPDVEIEASEEINK